MNSKLAEQYKDSQRELYAENETLRKMLRRLVDSIRMEWHWDMELCGYQCPICRNTGRHEVHHTPDCDYVNAAKWLNEQEAPR